MGLKEAPGFEPRILGPLWYALGVLTLFGTALTPLGLLGMFSGDDGLT